MKEFILVAVWFAVAIIAVALALFHRRGILPVALHSFRQFLQIRFFLPCFLVLCAAVLIAAAMKPANPSDRLRLLQTNVFAISGFVVAVIVLAHSATSYPREVSQKQTYHIFSKPLSRSAFITGRVLGYSLAGGFLLFVALILNLIVIGFLAVSDAHFRSLRQTREYLSARSHSYAGENIQTIPDSVIWLEGTENGVCWHFLLPVPRQRLAAQLTPAVAGAISTEAIIRARNTKGEEIERKIAITDNRPYIAEFNFQQESATFSIEVMRFPKSAPIGFNLFQDDMGFETNGLVLVADSASFELNLALGYLTLFSKVSLFAAVGVFCSSFLSAPVAIFFAFFLYFLSHLVPFLSSAAMHVGKVETHHVSPVSALPTQLTSCDYTIVAIINAFCLLFPDSLRFDLSSSVCAGRALSLRAVVFSLLYYGKYLLLLTLFGSVLLKRREV